MNVIKRAQNTFFWAGKLRRFKIRAEKRLRKVNDPERKNYLESGFGRKHVRESYARAKKIESEEDLVPLSKGLTVDHRYPVLNFEKEAFNKEMKKALKQRMDLDGKQTFFVEKEGFSLTMSPKADQINRITAEEWDKYKRVFYEKNEIKRLIAKKDKDPEEILALGPTYEGNIEFVKSTLSVLKEGTFHGPPTGQSNIHSIQLLPHHNYRKELQSIKNDKIDGLIGLHNANDKLKELLECGFMDKSKTIEQVFTTLQKSNLQKALLDPSNSLIPLSSGDISSALHQMTPANSMTNEERKNMWSEFSSLIAEDPGRASAMELVVSAVEKEGLQGTYNSDYLGLVDFVKDFIELDQKEKSEVYERMGRIKDIRKYEEGLLEHREDHMLERRGRPLFSKLKTEEMIPYIKHNAHFMQDIFAIVKQEEACLQEHPEVAVAMIEKLALGFTLGPLFYKDSKFIDLQTISQKEYHTLLKIVKNTLGTLDFESLTRTTFVLGRLHQREAGELLGDLYKSTARAVVLSFSAKLGKLQEIISSDPTSSDLAANHGSMMYNLGIGLQGLLMMGCINKSTPPVFVEQILDILSGSSVKISEGCTLNRVLATLNQIVAAYGVAYEERTVDLLNRILEQTSNEFIEQMGRPDLLDLATNLISLQGLEILLNPKSLLPVVNSLKVCVLKADNLEALTLANVNELLLLFVGTNTLDVKSKNQLKKKIAQDLPVSSNILSFVLPQTIENLAISDLKDSNSFYGEYTTPGELLLVKGLFGIRPFELDNTPRFTLYRDIFKLVMTEADAIKKADVSRVIDGLCAVEVPLEVFQYSILDKTIEEMLEKDIRDGRNFDSKLAARVALLFSNMGVYNLRDKWVKLCLAHFIQGTSFRPDSVLDLLCCADLEIVQHYGIITLQKLVAPLIDKQNQLSPSKKAILVWNLHRLNLDDEIDPKIPDLCTSLVPSSLKTLDLLLLSQVPEADSLIASVPKHRLISLYTQIHHRVSPVLSNDTSSLYAALKTDLDRCKQPYKESQWISHEGLRAYVHLYLVKKKTAVAIYPDDIFLNELILSQNTHHGYDYKVSVTEKLPFFFELNEQYLRDMGLSCTRLPASSAREAFIETGLEERLKNELEMEVQNGRNEQSEENATSENKTEDLQVYQTNPSRSKNPKPLRSSRKPSTGSPS